MSGASPTSLTLRKLREDGYTAEVVERVLSHVSVQPDGCWLWGGARDVNGYGRCNRATYGEAWAHRLMYRILVGAIADGLQIDHLCRVRLCVNPAHLEPVTQSINSLRSPIIGRTQSSKTHCVNGHERVAANLYVHPATGHSACRICKIERQRVSRS